MPTQPPDMVEPVPTFPRTGTSQASIAHKLDIDTESHPPRPPHRFSNAPHYDFASSTAYIDLPASAPGNDAPIPRPRGKLSSFFRRNLGLCLIASAQLFFSMMNLCAKLLSMGDPPIHPFEIILVRMLVTWLGSMAYLHYSKVPDYFLGPKGVRLLLMVRGVVGFFGLFGVYYSLQYLHLSDATVLTFLAPILTGYFGRIFLKEPFLRTELYAGILSLVGVILIAHPQSLFGDSSGTTVNATNVQRLSAVGVALLGVMGIAGAYTSIRAIGTRAHPLIMVSMLALYSTIVATIGLIVIRQPLVIPRSLVAWGEWSIIGISGFVAQLLLTSGLQRERAGRGVSMAYLQMVFAFGFERIVWDVIPDFWSISGSGLILGGAIWVAVAKSRIANDPDDLERNGYVLLNEDEQALKESGFELDEISGGVGKHVGMPSSPPPSESRDSQKVAGETEEGVIGRRTEFGD